MNTYPILVCMGCKTSVSTREPTPFRCPYAEDGGDHVLRAPLDPGTVDPDRVARAVSDPTDANPFVRFRDLLVVYRAARARGMGDADYLEIARELDHAIAATDGTGFVDTPFTPAPGLITAAGLSGSAWVKNETVNVSGSHKGRHLMGLALWLAVVERTQPESRIGERRLAIASCGNAALAAAVVAKAAGRPLDVFVPPDAHPTVLTRLEELEATLVPCPRPEGGSGDPCMHRFLEAVEGGALPFSVQGSENGLTLDGGKTLAFEMAATASREGISLDRVFVQVGGGALGSSLMQGFSEAVALHMISHRPRVMTVQTEGATPLARAWGLFTEYLGDHLDLDLPEHPPERAEFLRGQLTHGTLEHALHFAAQHREDFMWPWETPPHSVATGILDDETYDWVALTEALVETAGWPVTATEDQLQRANTLARDATGIDVDPTGSAGLGGWISLADDGLDTEPGNTVVLLTGVVR